MCTDSRLQSIIAAHGLGGHWKDTLTAENGKIWLRDFLPLQLSEAKINARVMSYGYNAPTTFSKAVTPIDHEAEALLDRLDGNRELIKEKRRPIVFVSHSLGGLIVKKVMILAWENLDKYNNLMRSSKYTFGCICRKEIQNQRTSKT